MSDQFTVSVLGPCVVTATNVSSGLRELIEFSAVQRRILERLALARPGSVSLDELAQAIWGDKQPATAVTAIYNQISRIRSRLSPSAIDTMSGRYSLTMGTDVEVAAQLLQSAEEAFGRGAYSSVLELTATALKMWRGTPFVELDDIDEARFERQRLEEVSRSLETLHLEAAIEAGRLAWAIPEAERLVSRTPGDEHRWILLVRALAKFGRRGDALGAYERARRTLAESLGLAPSEALRAAEAEALHTNDAERSTSSVALVGREDLINRAVEACDQGASVLLVGESGIGKSRVLAEVQRRLKRRGFTVAASEAPLHAATPVATLHELAEALEVPFKVPHAPIETFVATINDAVSARGRVMLSVDDLDRAGPTTIHALRSVAAIRGVSLLAAATELGALEDGGWGATLVVEPLGPERLAELAEAILGVDRRAEPERLRWLFEMSGGNPAFFEHLLEDPIWLVDGEPGSLSDTGREPPHPQLRSEVLRDVVRRRVARLGASSRAALEVAAVCGPQCPVEVVHELALEEGVSAGVAASLLTLYETSNGHRWVGFRHGAVREILYDDMPPGRRMEIHYRAAGFLRASGAPVTVVAAHSTAAMEVDPLAAAEDAMAAGAIAIDQGAYSDAAEWFGLAIEAARRSGSSRTLIVRALISYGDALRRAGSPDQEDALFEAAEAAFALGSNELISEAAFVVLQLGATTESGRLHERATDLARRALDVVHAPDARALIAGAASLAMSMSDESGTCRELFLEAIDGASTARTRRLVLPFTYLGLGHPSDLELRESLTNELLELADAADDPVSRFEGLQLKFSVALQRCDGATARQVVAESAELIDLVGDVGRRWSLEYQRAAISFLDDELEVAEAHAERSLEIFGPVTPSRAFAAYGAQLLVIRLAQSRLGELVETIDGLLAEQPGVPAWNAALALAVAHEDPERARKHAAAALCDVVEDFTWLAAHVIGGRAAAITRDPDLCENYLTRLSPYSRLGCWQGTCSYGPVDTVLWQLHRARDNETAARTHLEIARASAEQLEAPIFIRELT